MNQFLYQDINIEEPIRIELNTIFRLENQNEEILLYVS